MKPISDSYDTRKSKNDNLNLNKIDDEKISTKKMSIMKYSGQLFTFPITHCLVIT